MHSATFAHFLCEVFYGEERLRTFQNEHWQMSQLQGKSEPPLRCAVTDSQREPACRFPALVLRESQIQSGPGYCISQCSRAHISGLCSGTQATHLVYVYLQNDAVSP